LTRILVVYESKYGNTKLLAEKIAEGAREVERTEVLISEVKRVGFDTIHGYDAVLIGSPNNIGGPTRGIRKFIDKLGKLKLGDKGFAVFDSYMGRDIEKAVKKMERRMSEKVAEAKLLTPGLSMQVEGTKGPISEGELPKAREFGNRIAAQLKA